MGNVLTAAQDLWKKRQSKTRRSFTVAANPGAHYYASSSAAASAAATTETKTGAELEAYRITHASAERSSVLGKARKEWFQRQSSEGRKTTAPAAFKGRVSAETEASRHHGDHAPAPNRRSGWRGTVRRPVLRRPRGLGTHGPGAPAQRAHTSREQQASRRAVEDRSPMVQSSGKAVLEAELKAAQRRAPSPKPSPPRRRRRRIHPPFPTAVGKSRGVGRSTDWPRTARAPRRGKR